MWSTKLLKLSAVLGIACLAALAPMAASAPAESGVGPKLQSVGPIAFGPDDILFVADNRAAMIFALELGDRAAGGTPGTKGIKGIDQKIAGLLGTDAREILISDLAVSPSSRNAFIAVSRGQGANAMPVLLRVDGGGRDRGDLAGRGEIFERGAAKPTGREPHGTPRSTHASDHRHGLRRGASVHRRSVKRRV